MQAWAVYLGDEYVGTFFFGKDISAKYVKYALVAWNWFDPAITVQKVVYSLPKDFE